MSEPTGSAFIDSVSPNPTVFHELADVVTGHEKGLQIARFDRPK